MFGLIGRMLAVPGQRDALIEILNEGTRNMPGCLSYVVARDPSDEVSVWITEIWDTKSSHEASLSLPAVRDAIERGRSLIAGFGERFETNPVDPDGYKPVGYTSVSPYLIVSDADRTIKFLEAVFGAREIRRFPGEGARVMHAEVRLNDSIVMMGEPIGDWQPVPALVHVYVANVDETYRRALEAGAESVQEPAQKDDPDKRGGVKDADGISWWISTSTESEPG